jgi:hypothetical protein
MGSLPVALAREPPYNGLMMSMTKALSLVALLPIAGCATLAHGTRAEVPVIASSEGARVAVDGNFVGEAPLRVPLDRRSRHTIYIDTTAVRLGRSMSWWMLGNALIYYVPAALDVANGAMFNLSPDSIDYSSDSIPRRWHVARGQAIRISPERAPAFETRVDSQVASTVFTPRGSYDLQVDTPRIDVKRFTSRLGNSLSTTRRVLRATSPALLVPYLGEYVWLEGAAIAPVVGLFRSTTRWAPMPSYESGSTLTIGDDIRYQLETGGATGKFVDATRTTVFVKVSGTTYSLKRDSTLRLDRRDGYAFGRAAKIGALVGTAAGLLLYSSMTVDDQQKSGGMWFVAGVAGIGAAFSIPFAPAHWVASGLAR